MAKKIVVIRIGEKETQIVHMEHTGTNPTVYGCVRFRTPENAVQDGMILDMPEMASRIHKTCAEKGIKTKEAIFTIASGKIASREVSIPVVNKSKIRPLVMAKISDLFPIDTEKYVFSFVTQGEVREDENAEKIQDVLVFAAPSELIDSYYALANATGFHVVALEADGNAVYQIMKRQAGHKVSMSVQINGTVTLVNIISDDRLLLQRVVPYGVNVFTEVMVQEPAFQTPTEMEAFKLLKKNRVIMHHLNAENPEKDPSIEKRIEVTDNASFLLGNIGRVIEYYNSKYKDQPIEEIICMGQGCAIAGIHELISNELGIPAFTPQKMDGIRFNRSIRMTAYTLQYINCFGSVFEPVGFVPRELEQKAQKRGSLTGAVLIFSGCLLISMVVCGFSILQLVMTKDTNTELASRATAMASIQNEYDSLLTIDKNMVLVEGVKAITNTRNNHFHSLLKQIESYVPKTFRIQNITSDEQHVTVSATSVDKLLSLSALQIQLNKIKEIQNVKLDSITEVKEAVTKQKQYTYNISFDYKIVLSQKKEGEQP